MVDAKKNVFWLGITSFLTDIASEMIFPILPVFLTVVLGAPVAVVGIVEGVAESVSAFLKLFSGWFSDFVRKRKVLAVIGYSLSAVSKPLMAIAGTWLQLLLLRSADRAGKGIRTAPRDALIAEAPKAFRGRLFGLHRFMDTLGAVVGTLITAGILYFLPESYRLIFALTAIPCVLGVIILVGKVKEAKPRIISKAGFAVPARLRPYLFVTAIFGLGNFSYAFLILRAKDVGIEIALLPIVYLVYNLVYSSSAYPAGRLSDAFGRKPIMVFGYALFGVVAAVFAVVQASWMVWVLFGLYGIVIGITDSVGRAYASDLAGARKGTSLGAYHLVVGIVVLIANILGGYLWQFLGVEYAFGFAAVTSIISALALLLI